MQGPGHLVPALRQAQTSAHGTHSRLSRLLQVTATAQGSPRVTGSGAGSKASHS